MTITISKKWQGFVPARYPHSLEQCAYYHCGESRWEGRRYCKLHAWQYDKEVKETTCQVLSFAT